MKDSERFEAINTVLEDLSLMVEDHIILVEGINDEKALRKLGVSGTYYKIQSEGGPVKAAEYVFGSGKRAAVLTDWDHKGGILSENVCNQLSALGVMYDITIRRRLSILCSVYIKDVESLDVLMERLNSKYERSRI